MQFGVLVSQVSIRLRILKELEIATENMTEAGFTGVDPFEDTESRGVPDSRLVTVRVSQVSIRLRILKVV